MTNLEKLYKKIAKEHNLTQYQVEDIFKSQFDLVAKEMEARSPYSIRLPRFGVFIPNLKRREIIKQKEYERDQRLNEQSKTL